jgi:hypothetical protein
MKLIAYFSDNGEPKTGLSPIISVIKVDGTAVITDQSMIESGLGFYYYDFTDYNEDEDYCIRADGGSSLSNQDRYVYSTNETAGVGKILKIQKNKWEIKNNQLIFYDDDGTTILYTFNLQNKAGGKTDRDVYQRVPV